MKSLSKRHLYPLVLLAILVTAFLTHKDLCFDFLSYHAAINWSEETGELPYLLWQGEPFVPATSELGIYHQSHYGRTLYPFLYPPSAVLQLKAFSMIPSIDAAILLWRMFCIGSFVLILLMAKSFVRHLWALYLLIVLFAAYTPTRDSVWLGQVSLWVAFLLMLFYWSLHRRRGLLAGVALGLAVSLKIFPILWAPLMLLYGRRVSRRCALGLVATVAASVVFSLPTYGIESWTQFYSLVLAKIPQHPPSGTLSAYAVFGLAGTDPTSPIDIFLRRALFFAIYLPAVFFVLRRGRGGVHRIRTSLIVLTAAIHLAMPLTWGHYLTFLGILLSIEIAHLIGHWRHRFPIAIGVAIGAFLLTGCRLLIFLPGLSDHNVVMRTGLFVVLFIPIGIRWDLMMQRKRNEKRNRPLQPTPAN